MKTITITLLFAGILSLAGCASQTSKSDIVNIEWDNSLVLPSVNDSVPNIGVAGAFAGIVDGKLIVAGGANFPDGYPWTGAKKVWHDDMYVFNPDSGEWTVYPGFMNEPLAYGVSIQLPQGVLMIGGNNGQKTFPTVDLLTMRDGQIAVDSIAFPNLPFSLANTTGAMADNKIFLAGGVIDINDDRSSDSFLMLDLEDIESGWQQLPSWPGAPLGYSVSAGVDGKFYLFSGRDFGPDRELTKHDEGYCYDPQTNIWTKLDNSFPFMAGTAIVHDGKVVFLGGVEKVLPTAPEHPGFPRVVRSYDVHSNTLDTICVSPYPITVTTTAVVTGDTVYIASGEEKPGIRSPHILRGVFTSAE